MGAMANLGHKVSDQTIGNILKRHDIPAAPKPKQATSWNGRRFIATSMRSQLGEMRSGAKDTHDLAAAAVEQGKAAKVQAESAQFQAENIEKLARGQNAGG